LPLVLPPTVLGFYLLLALSPGSWFGSLAVTVLGKPLVFSFEGLVIGSVLYSLPFMVYPVQSGMKGLSPRLYEAAQSLGKSNLQILWDVVLPNIRPSLLAGLVLTFAHTVGEFGVVLMIGGSIPGETRVASIAIYDEVEALNYSSANKYALILVGISFLALTLLYSGQKRINRFW
jgi:molybdate transport system permease protein